MTLIKIVFCRFKAPGSEVYYFFLHFCLFKVKGKHVRTLCTLCCILLYSTTMYNKGELNFVTLDM